MIRFFAAAAFALAVATSAQAMSPAPLHQGDGLVTQVRAVVVHRGHVAGHGVARRQVRRCAVWGAGHVCRSWVY